LVDIQYNSGGILQGTVTVIPRTFVKGSNCHEPQTMKLKKTNNFKLLMDYVAANDRRFKKREKEETDAFSE
jgi:hypothetical protein